MKRLICVLAAALVPAFAAAAEKPEWAFPTTEKVLPKPRIEGSVVRTKPLPGGGTITVTRAGADDFYNVPDWRPDLHPAMPKSVQYGNKDTQARACGSCHLPTGNGHDESAYTAGLPVNYFMRQMADWKSGARKFGGIMVSLAKIATDDEIRAAAEFYASVKPRQWIRVVEADIVPKSFIGPGNKRLEHPVGGTEALGNQIIEVPENEEDVVYRDPTSGFVAYVPKGSIAKGEALVKNGGGGKTIACGICHGPTLQGLGEVPALAGRHPNYIVRQLWNMQNGERIGPSAALMQAVVAKLSNDDMLAIAAYTASLAP
jgi:cytochrome c553